MKKLYIILGLTVTVLFSLHTQAQNCRFPSYGTTDFTLTMNLQIDSVNNLFMPDSSHCMCDLVFSYNLTGLVPADDDSRFIALAGGSQNPSQDPSLPAALCRLLQAYQQQSVSGIAAISSCRCSDY